MDYFGNPSAVLENEAIRVEYLSSAGPRIVRFSAAGQSVNLLAETPDVHWETPYGTYRLFGGHRLTHAPEALPRTYIPENDGVHVVDIPGGVSLHGGLEPITGIRKTIDLVLEPHQPVAHLTHRLENTGQWPVELSPWAVTQVRLGGVMVLPQPEVDPGQSSHSFANRSLVLWSYTHWDDPRQHLHDDFILVHAKSCDSIYKIGYLNRCGWVGYLYENFYLVKRFNPALTLPHPDRDCNVEVYCNHHFAELETLAPLVSLAPGQTVEYTETWELYVLPAPVSPTIEGIREIHQTLRFS